MRVKVLFAGLSHETNTFSSRPTTLADFERSGFFVGDETARLEGTNTETGGVLRAAAQDGLVDLIPIVATSTEPGGLVAREVVDRVAGMVERGIAQEKPDAIVLDLHGAMVSEGEDDGDGAILRRVRHAAGPDTPIVAVLDLHANVGPEMLDHATALIPYDEYPHIDVADRGEEGFWMAVAAARGDAEPTMAHARIPIMPAGPKQFSRVEPTRSIMEHVHEIEKRDGVLSAGVCFAFPWADCPFAGMTATVITDGKPELAEKLASEIAEDIWSRREEFRPEPLSVEEAVHQAMEHTDGPVVLADLGDNPGGGSAADGTALLWGMLDLGAKNAAYALIADPEAVRAAVAAGVGAVIEIELGGKTDDLHGHPIPVRATVKNLSDGDFVNEGPMLAGVTGHLGPTAVLGCEGRYGDEVEVIVTTNRYQPFDKAIFSSQGIDPTKKRILGVKSAVHFRNSFMPIASEILEVDTPGLTSIDYSRFPYTRLPRPIWPFDEFPK